MPSLRSVLRVALAISALTFAQVQEAPSAQEVESLAIDDFRQLLEELPAESLHAVLDNHLAPKFQDGVFEQEHNAIKAIHSNDPLLATKLVELAKHDAVRAELRKRQNGTDTTTTVVDTTTTATVAVDTTSGTVLSNTQGSSPISTTDGSTIVTVSPVTAPVTTTDSSGSTVTSASVIPGSTTVQTPGGSASTSSIPVESSPAVASTNTGFLVPVAITTTNSAGSTTVQTTSAFEASTQASLSVDIPITTTNAQGSTITTSSRVAGGVFTSTNAQGQAVTRTSALPTALVNGLGSLITAAPSAGASTRRGGSSASDGADVTTTDQYGNTVVLSDVSYGEVITATDAKGSTFITTYTPGGGRVSSIVLKTTTLPDGQVSTITSFAVIGGQAATSTAAGAAATPATSTSAKPGLQSGLARGTKGMAKEVMAVIGGAVGVAYLL